jgi:hypothetical protein
MRRRDVGETVTVAQNLFEPDASGPVVRPPIEQGDADQRGVRIILDDGLGAMKPIPDPVFRAPPARVVQVSDKPRCVSVKSFKIVKRHGRRVKVAELVKKCSGGGKVVQTADLTPCKATSGRHSHGKHARHDSCKSAESLRVASASDSRGHGKAGGRASRSRGDWQVQVGAYRDRSQAKSQLATLGRKFSAQFAEADAQVSSKSDGLFRARFVGLTSAAAQDACSTLRARGHGCLALPAG